MTWLRTAGNRCSIGEIHGVDVLRPASSILHAAEEGSSDSKIETSESSHGRHAKGWLPGPTTPVCLGKASYSESSRDVLEAKGVRL